MRRSIVAAGAADGGGSCEGRRGQWEGQGPRQLLFQRLGFGHSALEPTSI